jgi:hypothetical protein
VPVTRAVEASRGDVTLARAGDKPLPIPLMTPPETRTTLILADKKWFRRKVLGFGYGYDCQLHDGNFGATDKKLLCPTLLSSWRGTDDLKFLQLKRFSG